MGRDRRVIDPGAIYHVMCRGSDRKLIALDGEDYRTLTALISKAATRYRWEVFAWCLMPNHYHLVMRVPRGGFSEGFRMINQSHSFRFNRRHGHSAHLFRHRPHCIELLGMAHLVAAIVYVVRNPIRAKLCEFAWQWPYSSYRATVGLAAAPEWLALDFVRDLFGGVDELKRLVHREQFAVSNTEVGATPG